MSVRIGAWCYLDGAVLVTILTVAEVVYVVVLSTWILLEKRSPIATLAWILALIALPYVGLVVYFFLGPRRLQRRRLKMRHARGKSRAEHAEFMPPSPSSRDRELAKDPRVSQLERLAIECGEGPVDPCEDVEIFLDAKTTYDAIERAIAEATHHIHVAYYIFDSGRIGTRLAAALMARARAGITVRLLLDHVGSSAMSGAMLRALRESGVKVAFFHPVRFSRIRRRMDFRNHRKIIVTDGRVGFTGGINVCDDYLPDERGARSLPWRDTHVRLKGDAVRWLQLTFLDDWHYATRYATRDPEYFPALSGKGNHRVQIVASGPDRETFPIKNMYFASIAMAEKRVLVTTPYFVPEDAISLALITAALRGVDVRVLVPRRTDSFVVTAAARSYYDGILAAGARVFEYEPTMIHAKTLVVDDFFATVGTANMDPRSFRLNFEVMAVLYGKAHAETLAAAFDRDLAHAKEVTKATRERNPLGWRVAEAGARLMSPIL